MTDVGVKHENCATDYGLNHGQEDEKKGSWRWVVLPTIVVVTHLCRRISPAFDSCDVCCVVRVC